MSVVRARGVAPRTAVGFARAAVAPGTAVGPRWSPRSSGAFGTNLVRVRVRARARARVRVMVRVRVRVRVRVKVRVRVTAAARRAASRPAPRCLYRAASPSTWPG